MKVSLFNTFIEHKNHFIGYNTLYETIILLNKNLYYIINKNNKDGDIDGISNMHAQLFDTLKEHKFIIDEREDELEIVKKIITETNNDDSVFEITINPTLNCNFKCWYCYENHNDKSKITSFEREKIITLINKIVYKNKKLKLLRIAWFGGEPLLYFKSVIVPIMSEIKNITSKAGIGLVSGMTTNGYLINEQVLYFLKEMNHKTFQITLDGNTNRHNEVRYIRKGDNTYSTIVRNIILCLNNGFYVSVRLNLSLETELDVEALLNDFSGLSKEAKEHLCFSIHKVWQAPDSVEETVDDVVKKIRESDFNSSTYYSNPNTIRNTCYADKKNHITINPMGKIFKCTARDFIDKNVEGNLLNDGDIAWNASHKKRQEVSVFKYRECLSCCILPICNAGCSQKKMENPEKFCFCSYDEELKIRYAKNVLFEKLRLS